MGKNKKFHKKEKITNETILSKIKYNFSRDSEWFKRTTKKIDDIKEELNKNFYNEERKKQKIDFIHKLREKLKDYKDAIKFEGRYKKVRFVERRKLERKLTKINKEIDQEKNNEKLIELNKNKQNIIDDINYVKFYPKTYKYYSLFPNKDVDNEEMKQKREKMKQKIKFYLNGKKNKEKGVKEENDSINENNEDNVEKESDEEEKDKKNITKSSKKEVSNEKKENQIKQKKNKNNKDKNCNEEIKNNDYENTKKKKVFKDDFFELDE